LPKGFCTGSPDVKTKDPSFFIACLELKTGDFRGWTGESLTAKSLAREYQKCRVKP
jgi:hypothetical protein